jgi:tetratricopeptide (TPR) repeat protein
VAVFPFENKSRAPGLDWIGESFSEVLGPRLTSVPLLLVNRDDRTYAFERAGIPAGAGLSRATVFKIAEEMDVDYAVIGSYSFDGRTFSARSQLMDVKRARILPEVVETGALTQLLEIQGTLAWNLLRQLGLAITSRNNFLNAGVSVRLDALENYVRGVTAGNQQTRLKFLREAVRFSPDYPEANLQLGKTLVESGQYESAISALAKIPVEHPLAAEAQFFSGLAYYLVGKPDRAEAAFRFVAERFPLIEVYNNLGVVAAQNGKVTAARDYFQRAAQADSRDSDYRFNLGVTLYRIGDYAGAQRQLKETLALKPQDTEAQAVLGLAVAGKPFGSGPATRPPSERIKRNYDATALRQLAELEGERETRYATLPRTEHAAAHVRSGKEMMRDGILEQAEAAFREAILLDPNNVEAHLGLARVLESRNELAEARAEARTANRLEVTADAFLVITRVELKQSRYEAAAESLARALKIDPMNKEAAALQQELARQRSGAAGAGE